MMSIKKLFEPTDMTEGTPWKSIVSFSIPLLIGNIAQQLYSTVDSIVVGHYIGDNALAAQEIGMCLGITEIKAELLPQDKVASVCGIIEKAKGNVAFVGDGINDAPVIARADVGIAMGAIGADAAIEAADVVLMDDDPAKIPLAVKIAKRTQRIVVENIVFALVIKCAVLALCAFGLVGMWVAAFADVGVSVIAILNAMRAIHS